MGPGTARKSSLGLSDQVMFRRRQQASLIALLQQRFDLDLWFRLMGILKLNVKVWMLPLVNQDLRGLGSCQSYVMTNAVHSFCITHPGLHLWETHVQTDCKPPWIFFALYTVSPWCMVQGAIGKLRVCVVKTCNWSIRSSYVDVSTRIQLLKVRCSCFGGRIDLKLFQPMLAPT